MTKPVVPADFSGAQIDKIFYLTEASESVAASADLVDLLTNLAMLYASSKSHLAICCAGCC